LTALLCELMAFSSYSYAQLVNLHGRVRNSIKRKGLAKGARGK